MKMGTRKSLGKNHTTKMKKGARQKNERAYQSLQKRHWSSKVSSDLDFDFEKWRPYLKKHPTKKTTLDKIW